MLVFPSGPFIRPHPLLWRVVFGQFLRGPLLLVTIVSLSSSLSALFCTARVRTRALHTCVHAHRVAVSLSRPILCAVFHSRVQLRLSNVQCACRLVSLRHLGSNAPDCRVASLTLLLLLSVRCVLCCTVLWCGMEWNGVLWCGVVFCRPFPFPLLLCVSWLV